jgi:hypothetical protein
VITTHKVLQISELADRFSGSGMPISPAHDRERRTLLRQTIVDLIKKIKANSMRQSEDE